MDPAENDQSVCPEHSPEFEFWGQQVNDEQSPDAEDMIPHSAKSALKLESRSLEGSAL